MPTNRTDENKTIQELEPKNKRTKNVKPRQFWRGPRVPGSAEPDWPPLDKALERTRRTRIASQSVPEFQPMWCQFTTVTSNKGAATDLELTRANRTTRCMYECFTDHTLAHPLSLNCRGRVMARLSAYAWGMRLKLDHTGPPTDAWAGNALTGCEDENDSGRLVSSRFDHDWNLEETETKTRTFVFKQICDQLFFVGSVFSEQTSGCRQSEIGRACCAEVAPGPKHTKIGDDNCVHHDVERAQTTQ